MNKKLAAKTQKLVPVLEETATMFSSSIAIEPPERELVLKKGSVYTVFDINSPVSLNVSLISKVINDVLYDSYYHSENISPIQSLEKAVVNINDKISTLAAEAASSKQKAENKDAKLTFDIVACVLWGNVLYMVQYGRGKSFLMREGEVKEVSSTSEGNFSVASGVVKNGDVIVLCTESFSQKYPPNKLLDSSVSSKDLEADSSSLILKFMVDEEFTEDEVIDFGVKPDKKGSVLPDFIKGFKGKKDDKEKDQTIESLVDNDSAASPVAVQPKPAQPRPVQPKKDMPNIKVRSQREPKIKVNTKTLTVIVGVLLVVSVVTTLIIRSNRFASEDQSQAQDRQGSSLFVPRDFSQQEEETSEQPQPEEKPAESEQEPEEDQAQQDAQNKVARIDTQPFYDIKLADENAEPSGLAQFTDVVVVTDQSSGKLFTSNVSSPKFTALEQSFSGISDVVNYEGLVNFSDESGYKAYDLTDNTVASSYDGEFGVSGRYLDNIYSIENNSIIKYVPEEGSLTSSDWGEDEALSGAKAMDIAYSIYVVSQEDELLVYTQGERTDFGITGLDVPLNNVTDIEVDVNFNYIYLADAGNNRVVVLSEDGEFIKQIKATEDNMWSDIRAISIDQSESTLFVLNGSRVFKVDLTQANVPEIEA